MDTAKGEDMGDASDVGPEPELEANGNDCELSPCLENDGREPNELPQHAAIIPWDSVGPLNSYVEIDAFLCSGEDDWYAFSVDDLDYDDYALYVDGIAEGSSWCGESCEQAWLPDAPENAIAVDVFDAHSLLLLASNVAQNGRIDINGNGEQFSRDLLVHVYGPTPAASYAYQLRVEIRGFDGEDECEC